MAKRQKDRKHNGQKKKYKRRNNDIQNVTHKTKHRGTLKIWGEVRCSDRFRSSCSTSGISRVTLVTYQVISHQ